MRPFGERFANEFFFFRVFGGKLKNRFAAFNTDDVQFDLVQDTFKINGIARRGAGDRDKTVALIRRQALEFAAGFGAYERTVFLIAATDNLVSAARKIAHTAH